MYINLLCLRPLTESKAAMHDNKNVRNEENCQNAPRVKHEMNVKQ